MSVTPQINDNDTVLLNVRPSITRLLLHANDPTPGLALASPELAFRKPQLARWSRY